jgi:hypothetical protein
MLVPLLSTDIPVHEPLIDTEAFEQVQALLRREARSARHLARVESPGSHSSLGFGAYLG